MPAEREGHNLLGQGGFIMSMAARERERCGLESATESTGVSHGPVVKVA